MGLVALLLVILLGLVNRMARIARLTSASSIRRKAWMEAAELLRWELRNLLVPSSAGGAPASTGRSGLLGDYTTGLWGEPGQEGHDNIYFLTNRARKARGTCEVDFRLRKQTSSSQKFDLAYRQFTLRDRAGLHGNDDVPEAPWQVLLTDVTSLSFDYTVDGWTWTRDWSTSGAPRRVRVRMEAASLPVLDFQVTPGVGGGRW